MGVVGCGYWGPNLIRNLRSLSDCRLEVICDVKQERLKHLGSLYPEARTMTDYNEMVGRKDLDAIVIATPVEFHHRMAIASLSAGKHTFIEKPMAASSAECEDLIQLADNKGLVLMAGHTFLYSPAVR